MAQETIPALFDALTERHPESDAVVFPDSRSTYAALRSASIARARALRGAGVGQGDFVGLLLPADVGNIELLLGLWRLGAIPVPINQRFKASELRFVVEHSGMGLLLCDGPGLALAEEAGVGCRVVGLGADDEYAAGAAGVDAEEVQRRSDRVASGDDAVLLYTSGTTSNPKGALHTHASLLAEGASVAGRLNLTRGTASGPRCRCFTAAVSAQ